MSNSHNTTRPSQPPWIRSAVIALLLGAAQSLQSLSQGPFTLPQASPQLASRSVAPSRSTALQLSPSDLIQAKSALREGDIIFRSGHTWLTALAEQLQPADEKVVFSHVGIITATSEDIAVIHASIDPHQEQSVVEEPLADFLEKGNATYAVVYRLKTPNQEAQQAIAQAAKAYASAKVPFDAKFDLATEDQLYCSELIWRAYLAGGIDLSDQGFESFSFPFSDRYITPDSLSQSQNIKPVYQFATVQSAGLPTPTSLARRLTVP